MSLESLRGDDVPGAADGVCLDPVRIRRSINLGGMLSQRATMTSSLSRTSGVLSRTDLSSARPTKREVSSFAPSSARILGTEGCSWAEVSLILEMLNGWKGKNSILLPRLVFTTQVESMLRETAAPWLFWTSEV